MNWVAGSSLSYTGGSITVRNELGGQWNLSAGSYALSSNGNPNPLGSFTFVNAGSMVGAGVGSTTLSVANTVSFSNTGTVTGVNLVIQ